MSFQPKTIFMPFKLKLQAFVTFLSLFLCLQSSKAQTSSSTKDAIAFAFENYFQLERENIYVQLDKNLFFTNESIWFKGYVYNKKIGIPFYSTTNVYVQLINESGEVVSNQLLNCISGFFSGKIDLGDKVKSGYYHLQFYTNWMNNFEEDESFVQKIKIKKPQDKTIPLIEKLNTEKINLEFYPEGGNFVKNTINSVGFKITDANGLPIPNCALDIIDSNNQIIKSIVTNSNGNGKFEITPDETTFKAIVTYNDIKNEFSLPKPISNGIALEINNYAFEDKTSVKIRYNNENKAFFKNKTLFFVIQKNEKTTIIDVKLDTDNYSKEFLFSNEALFSGVNSIRLIDAEMNQLAHRLVYKNEINASTIDLNVAFKDDEKIRISGHSNWTEACVSASIIPAETKLTTNENLFTCLQINAYLNEKLNLKRDYFDDYNRAKKYELDLMFLAQKENKYNWITIKNSTPQTKYEFETGVNVKGVITDKPSNLKKYRIQMKSIFSDVLTSTETIENNEFLFKDTNLTDSLMVYCDLIEKVDRSKKEMNYYLTVVNKNKKYNKNFKPIAHVLPTVKDPNSMYDMNMPLFDDESILLKEVEIKSEKNKLKRQNSSGNSSLRGYKVGVDVSPNTDLLLFIGQNGFNVNRGLGAISITGKQRNSINAASFSTPIIFIDGIQVLDFEELSGIRMDEVDEIYISATQIIPSMNNNQGMIKIYRKQPELLPNNSYSKLKMIVGGFERILPFRNADYLSEFTTGFNNFGLIHWFPWVVSDENGNLMLTIANKKHKKVKVIIEGFSLDGKLISEEREVVLE